MKYKNYVTTDGHKNLTTIRYEKKVVIQKADKVVETKTSERKGVHAISVNESMSG